MSTWLFDLGNTRLKWAPLQADGQLGPVTASPHGDGDAWLQTLPQGQLACIASVAAPERRLALLDALLPRFECLVQVSSEAALGPLRIAYADPARLGVDRFLAMLGQCDGRPMLLVGVGTALTLDLVDGEGRHRGGRIAPAPDLMRQALHARATQLPPSGGRFVPFADTTEDALASGCLGAALGLIEHSLQAARAELGVQPQLRVHGGGVAALRPWLPEHVVVADAVLVGLARWHALRIA
ncbi:type III pantothenate kinase [Thermomonas hydrothermalis]|uniref:Type III pantothenate kinase n=1 Tax=Thermomonas hydrothermalis TaxID=213588 RepID=A0A1M4TJ70_9GAMM|nr:type III pantothenate kinase [Thermomonas hydrothermalis]MCL6619653.1 type III pantothenate kinase [Thermomonas hydrothermalis]SHE44542.1 type III pantothenate kinase [Thermomonas hydrothermalis]